MKPVAYALVTGASSGIGFEMAFQLAQKGYGLILVARRLNRLEELKEKILALYNVPVELVAQDLSILNAAQKLNEIVDRHKWPVEILVNNAGFGFKGDFLDSDILRMQEMVLLNVNTLTQLTHLFAQKFLNQQKGSILLVSSVLGFVPAPGMAVYAATKNYVQALGESLTEEFKNTPVKISTLCPGTTVTEFFEVAGQNVHQTIQTVVGMSAKRVAQIGLKALFNHQPVVIAGFRNQLNVFLLLRLPRALRRSIIGQAIRKFVKSK